MLASYCGICGKQFQSNDMFCAGCGAPRDDTNAPNTTLGRTPQAAEPAIMTQASAAVCLVDNCGVQAIGRCARCQRTFCASHQAYNKDTWGYPVPVASLCAQCVKDQREAERKNKEDWQAFEKYFANGEALATLRRSSVQKVKVYRSYRRERDHRNVYLRVGADKQYSFYGYGWVLGEFGWYLGDRGTYAMREVSRLIEEGKDPNSNNIQIPVLPNYITLLMDTDMDAARRDSAFKSTDYGLTEMAYNYGLAPVVPYADGYEHEVVQGWYRMVLTYDAALAVQVVKRLASATS